MITDGYSVSDGIEVRLAVIMPSEIYMEDAKPCPDCLPAAFPLRPCSTGRIAIFVIWRDKLLKTHGFIAK